jgi:hypothetical protein
MLMGGTFPGGRIQCSAFVKALAALLALVLVTDASAQNKLPNERTLETLVKSNLVTFNDAVVTGNFAVLHARFAKPLRDKYSPEQLAKIFKEFAEKKVELYVITTYKPTYDPPPVIDAEGKLLVKGIFPTEPSKVAFDLTFIPSDGAWRLIGINVTMKKAE